MVELDESGPHWDAGTALMNLRALLGYQQAIDNFTRHLSTM